MSVTGANTDTERKEFWAMRRMLGRDQTEDCGGCAHFRAMRLASPRGKTVGTCKVLQENSRRGITQAKSIRVESDFWCAGWECKS